MTKRLILMLPQSVARTKEFAAALMDARRVPDAVENPMGGGGSESKAVETGHALTHAVADRGMITPINIANPYFTVGNAKESVGLMAAKGVREIGGHFNTVVVVARGPVVEALREVFTGKAHISSPDEAVELESAAPTWEKFDAYPVRVTLLEPGRKGRPSSR